MRCRMRNYFIFCIVIVLSLISFNESADAKKFDASFVKSFEKGRLPDSPYKVGTRFGTISAGDDDALVDMYDGFFSYSAKKTTYYFPATDVVVPAIPAKGLAALYDGRPTEKTLKKSLGDLVSYTGGRKNIALYQVGKYYVTAEYKSKKTRFMVATSEGMRTYYGFKKIDKKRASDKAS